VLVGVCAGARAEGCVGAGRSSSQRPDEADPARVAGHRAGAGGLTRVSRLNKEALLARVWEALDLGQQPAGPAKPSTTPASTTRRQRRRRRRLSPVRAPRPAAAGRPRPRRRPAAPCWRHCGVPAPTGVPNTAPGAAHKFEVGRRGARPRRRRAPRPSGTFPGLRLGRVTAMPVDPNRLCVYWEVTDDSIERARQGLGSRRAGAWLCLRVYDVTGRIFDGQNAHSYFDHALGGLTGSGSSTSASRPRKQCRCGHEVARGLLREDRPFRPDRVPARRTGGLGRAGVADGAGVQRPHRGRGGAGLQGWSPGVPAPGPAGAHGDPGAHGGGDWHQVGEGGEPGGVRRRIWAGRVQGRDVETSWEERTEWEEYGQFGELESEVMRTLSWRARARSRPGRRGRSNIRWSCRPRSARPTPAPPGC
jgi:hypothetical protein